MCVNDSAQEIKTSTTFTCVFSHVFINHEQQQEDRQRERERERQHERTLSRSASISHSFFLSRTRAHNTTVDRSAVAVAAVDTVHSASQLSMHTMKMMIYIIYRFACECDCCKIDLLPLLMIYVIGCILVMRTVCAFLCAPAVHQLIVIAHYIANQCN